MSVILLLAVMTVSAFAFVNTVVFSKIVLLLNILTTAIVSDASMSSNYNHGKCAVHTDAGKQLS